MNNDNPNYEHNKLSTPEVTTERLRSRIDDAHNLLPENQNQQPHLSGYDAHNNTLFNYNQPHSSSMQPTNMPFSTNPGYTAQNTGDFSSDLLNNPNFGQNTPATLSSNMPTNPFFNQGTNYPTNQISSPQSNLAYKPSFTSAAPNPQLFTSYSNANYSDAHANRGNFNFANPNFMVPNTSRVSPAPQSQPQNINQPQNYANHLQAFINQQQSLETNPETRNQENTPLNPASPSAEPQKPMPYLMQVGTPSIMPTVKPEQDLMSSGMSSSNPNLGNNPNMANALNMANNPNMPGHPIQASTNSNVAGMMPQTMPNQNDPQTQFLTLQNRINMVVSQINHTQNNINAVSSSNSPNASQLVVFLTQRYAYLKNLYCSLIMQIQNLQRNFLIPIQQNFQPGVSNPIPNQPPYSMMHPQMGMPAANMAQPSNVSIPNRPGMMGNSMALRMNPPMVNTSMMMPPGLSRFQGPRSMFNFNSPFGQNRMMPQVDSMKGRRISRGGRKRRALSSESEEEEEITSSDAESGSPLTPSAFPMEDMELRRSTRIQKTKNYSTVLLLDSESEEDVSKKGNESPSLNTQDLIPFHSSDLTDGKSMLIEKILADRIKPTTEGDSTTPAEGVVNEEFFVKFKFYSYIHCEWCGPEELRRRDRNALSKIKRYKLKKKESPFLFLDDDPYNPDYDEIDRILDVKETPDPNNPGVMTTCYLVKWCSLPYDESTWEYEDIVDELSIQQFNARNTLPSKEVLAYKTRPQPYQWQKISTPPVYKNGNALREYQLEGINWLLYEYCVGANCILADEMGLGKTIQSISFLVEVRKMGIRGPFLIVAPLSTIGNWYREFNNWSDLNCVVLHGAAPSRNIIHRYELFFRDQNNQVIPDYCKFEVLITTYEMILSETKFLTSINWRIAIIDEAHRLKNRKCKLLAHLGNLAIEHRVLLTGTPLQNTLDELLSLLHFLDPSRASNLEQIMQQNTGKLETNTQVQQIQSFLKPIILRRLKEDVEKNIAPKEETIIEVEMTTIQKKVYRGVLERNLSFLTKGTSSSNLPNLMNIMMELRKCCNHPFLINGVEDKILNEFSTVHANMDRQVVYRKALIESSGKLVLVDKLLPKLRESGHKMLIFSQMVRVLDLLEEYLVANNFLFERIDGSVRGNLRQAAIDRFSKPDSDRCVFLLCTKAGGLGINLTAADTVIIFDSDWNPQNDIQAQARCHRIGQNKAVKVYRLICRKTYEREMFDRASLKLGLDKAVLQDINTTLDDKGQLNNSRAQLSKKEVEELLRKGAYAAVMDEDLDASAKFCSEDIEQILKRRATVIQLAGATKGSTFAKASFNADIGGEQVDIDDPDFWNKWAKSANIIPNKDAEYLNHPRIRKPVLPPDADDDYEVHYDSFYHQHSTRKREQLIPRTSWSKKEAVRVEKTLMIYGWGRWADILQNTESNAKLTTYDIEQISKSILVIVYNFTKSENTFVDFVEKALRMSSIKSRQSEFDSEDINYKPYSKRTRSGRSRSSKIKKTDKVKICLMQCPPDWRGTNVDALVFDESYKKHLQNAATKILIRLRLLFTVEYYILSECKEDISYGVSVNELSFPALPPVKNSSHIPSWWDNSCDRSLIVGTYKYGFEKYDRMKTDKQLSFHLHIQDLKALGDADGTKRRGRKKKVVTPQQSDGEEEAGGEEVSKTEKSSQLDASSCSLFAEFPNTNELNTYLKRIVTNYWKNRIKTIGSKLDFKKIDNKTKWTKREELQFYKIATRFSVLLIDNRFVWDNFRLYAGFEKKDDENLTNYYQTLVNRCETLVKASQSLSADAPPPTDGFLTLRMALKLMSRVKLFRQVLDTLSVTNTYEVLEKAPPVGEDFPTWWDIQADFDILQATFMYGIKNCDLKMLQDKRFVFYNIIHEHMQTNPQITSITAENLKDVKSGIKWPKQTAIANRVFLLTQLLKIEGRVDTQPFSDQEVKIKFIQKHEETISRNVSVESIQLSNPCSNLTTTP